MQKYPSDAHMDDKYKAARLAHRVRSKKLRCHTCQRETPHYDQGRIGVNGPVVVCTNCGTERTP